MNSYADLTENRDFKDLVENKDLPQVSWPSVNSRDNMLALYDEVNKPTPDSFYITPGNTTGNIYNTMTINHSWIVTNNSWSNTTSSSTDNWIVTSGYNTSYAISVNNDLNTTTASISYYDNNEYLMDLIGVFDPESEERNCLKNKLSVRSELTEGYIIYSSSSHVELEQSASAEFEESLEDEPKFSDLFEKEDEDYRLEDLWGMVVDFAANDCSVPLFYGNFRQGHSSTERDSIEFDESHFNRGANEYYPYKKRIPWDYVKGEKNPLNTIHLDEDFKDEDIEMPPDSHYVFQTGHGYQLGIN